jgi:predicted transcriptional regulator
LVALSKITTGTTVEKFGSLINASYFDGANIAGALKTKGAIDFKVTYPAESEIIITEDGKKILELAEQKAKENFDKLDFEIIQKILQGSKKPEEIEKVLNINQQDIALHLYKLVKQNFVSYTLKGGDISVALTELGFKKASEGLVEEKKSEEKKEATQPKGEQASESTEEKKEEKEGFPLKLLGLIVILIILIALLLFLLQSK